MYARDHALIATPIGTIRVEGDEYCVTSVRLNAEGPPQRGSAQMVRRAAEQISEYFSGDINRFDVVLPILKSSRGTELRAGLIAVGYGETLSYGELARRLGSGPRAIGQLCARNSFPIIVPCHRILGAGGALGSYSAGNGPATKQWLLDHERRHSNGA